MITPLTEIIKEAPKHLYSCIHAVKEDGVIKVYIDGKLVNEIAVSGSN